MRELVGKSLYRRIFSAGEFLAFGHLSGSKSGLRWIRKELRRISSKRRRLRKHSLGTFLHFFGMLAFFEGEE